MSWGLYRTEPGRARLSDKCRGDAILKDSNQRLSFRGLDASAHGLGCILGGGPVSPGDVVIVHISGKSIWFHVMWCESHLGIENMQRVGLSTVDPRVDVLAYLRQLDLLAPTADVA